jgi:hypothetical protein
VRRGVRPAALFTRSGVGEKPGGRAFACGFPVVSQDVIATPLAITIRFPPASELESASLGTTPRDRSSRQCKGCDSSARESLVSAAPLPGLALPEARKMAFHIIGDKERRPDQGYPIPSRQRGVVHHFECGGGVNRCRKRSPGAWARASGFGLSWLPVPRLPLGRSDGDRP